MEGLSSLRRDHFGLGTASRERCALLGALYTVEMPATAQVVSEPRQKKGGELSGLCKCGRVLTQSSD